MTKNRSLPTPALPELGREQTNTPSPDWGRLGWGVARKGFVFCRAENTTEMTKELTVPHPNPPRVGEGTNKRRTGTVRLLFVIFLQDKLFCLVQYISCSICKRFYCAIVEYNRENITHICCVVSYDTSTD